MNYFLITLAVFAVVIPAMAVGFIFARKELKGSCGGLGKLMGDDCMFCDKKEECDKEAAHDEESKVVRLECTESGDVILKS